MSTPSQSTPTPADSVAPNVTVPAAVTDVTAPTGNLSQKPVEPPSAPVAAANPVTTAAASPAPAPAPVAPAPVAPAATSPAPGLVAPALPKPALKLSTPVPASPSANPARIAAAQKLPGRAPVGTADDDAPSPAITVLSGLAAAAAITFAVLLFLKTK